MLALLSSHAAPCCAAATATGTAPECAAASARVAAAHALAASDDAAPPAWMVALGWGRARRLLVELLNRGALVGALVALLGDGSVPYANYGTEAALMQAPLRSRVLAALGGACGVGFELRHLATIPAPRGGGGSFDDRSRGGSERAWRGVLRLCGAMSAASFLLAADAFREERGQRFKVRLDLTRGAAETTAAPTAGGSSRPRATTTRTATATARRAAEVAFDGQRADRRGAARVHAQCRALGGHVRRRRAARFALAAHL